MSKDKPNPPVTKSEENEAAAPVAAAAKKSDAAAPVEAQIAPGVAESQDAEGKFMTITVSHGKDNVQKVKLGGGRYAVTATGPFNIRGISGYLAVNAVSHVQLPAGEALFTNVGVAAVVIELRKLPDLEADEADKLLVS